MADVTPFELEVDFTSPYKRTKLYVTNGRAFFGMWRPIEVTLDGTEERVEVQAGLDGHLDLIADAVYGDRRLWPVIAQANRIDFPMEQVVAGTVLVIPNPAAVRAALIAASAQVEVQ